MRRYLIVDDNRDFADNLAEIVRDAGDEVTIAEGGPEALALARGTRFDAVLTDMRMPLMGGAELVHETFAPSGLSRDGASTGYRQVPIAAGRHRVRAQFNDDARASGFNYEGDRVIDAAAGQVVLIDFAAERGGVLIR